ncbi:MAG: Clp1/GlmU family protein [Candidatus Bathyarchaeia archaeon]
MNRTVEPNKTLLVDGPASVQMLSGMAEVFGAPLEIGEKIIIREGKRLPFEVKEKTMFNLTLGEGALSEEVDGSTIPISWRKTSEELLLHKPPTIVMVMGGVDCGKSSFCTFLANNALKRRLKVALIDADLGQSDVGPPSTVGCCYVKNFIKDPFDIKAEDAHFVGLTSPSKVVNAVVESLKNFKEKMLQGGAEFVIVNTDGWVEGEEAIEYKVKLTQNVKPNFVVGIEQKNELTPLMMALKETRIYTVESPTAIRRRDKEKRKILRELNYKKYLKGAKVQTFPLSWVKFEGAPLGAGLTPSQERMRWINEFLQLSPLYCEETPNTLLIVLKRGQWLNFDSLKKLEEKMGKEVKIALEGEENGLLVALQDSAGKFLGIGILLGIDFKRKTVKINTPVNQDISTVSLGQIKLDKNFKEKGPSSLFLNSEPKFSLNQRNF